VDAVIVAVWTLAAEVFPAALLATTTTRTAWPTSLAVSL
jgi:hypothetical protein